MNKDKLEHCIDQIKDIQVDKFVLSSKDLDAMAEEICRQNPEESYEEVRKFIEGTCMPSPL